MNLDELDTPALLVDLERLERNISEMAEVARKAGVALRPHTKTHKTPEIARIQLEGGARGICVQKLGEAEVMKDAGIRDILLTYQTVGRKKLSRLESLSDDMTIPVLIDSPENAVELSQYFSERGKSVPVYIEVDTGHGRCGVPLGEATLALARKLSGLPGIEFRGLETHEGQVYHLRDPSERERVTKESVGALVRVAEELRRGGIPVGEISVGATPSVATAAAVPGVTEIQPGNYVFYDMMQVGLGVVQADRCALSVLATVISRPTRERVVLDAGSKALSGEAGGYPSIKQIPDSKIVGMNEEHLWFQVMEGSEAPSVGDRIEVIPYHACTCTNMHETMYGVRDGRVEKVWRVAGRGKLQ